MAVIDYKCLNCNAKLEYKSDRQLWHCDYCLSEFTLDELEKVYAARDEKAVERKEPEAVAGGGSVQDHGYHVHDMEMAETREGEPLDDTQVREWHCDNCGAEIIGDHSTAATHCAYCGNSAIMPKQLEGTYRPEMVIPFAITKEQAEQALVDRVRKMKFVSHYFIEKKQTEKLMGVYVATWLYDTTVHIEATLSGEKVSTRRSGQDEITSRKIYHMDRNVKFNFEGVPVDASKKMDDTLMEAIEPFDYTKQQPFSLPYLSGFFADRYDEDAASRRQRADERVVTTAEQMLMDSVIGFSNVRITNKEVHVAPRRIVQALLPVWLMSVKWEGQDYLFAVNGQTGKFVGNLPIDKSLQWKSVFRFSLIGTILFFIAAFALKYFM